MRTKKPITIDPKPQKGTPVPLFDRLVDENPEADTEAPPLRIYTRDEVIQSIERDISRLLNTRANVKNEDYEAMFHNPMNRGAPELYGLRGFSHLDIANQDDLRSVQKWCENAITRYETRLRNVRVEAKRIATEKEKLTITVNADLALKEFQGSVTFPTVISIGG